MIAKDTTTTINFYVADTDGLPATGQASNISASISINGAQATAISDTITEKGSGWYKFNHTFSTAGNVFIEFTATDCIIMPWEDEVVEITGTSANDVARAVWSDTASYPIFQGQYPKGYYQANPPVVNVWGQTAYSGQSITYGDLMKSTAKSSELTGLSTFNPATDTVLIDYTQAATMTTATGFATPSDIPSSDITAIKTKVDSLHNTDLTGIATATNVSNAQAAIIAAMPDVSSLSTFDPATDKVTLNTTEDGTLTAIKTKVDTLQNTDISTLAKSSELTGLSTFDPATDQVSVSPFSASFIANQVWDGKEAYATPMDVSDAIRTINVSLGLLEEHGDTAWSTANISGLSTFNPATDTVQLDSTQLSTLATGSDVSDAKDDIIAALADIDIDTSDLAKATDVAVVADMIKQVDAGVLHWSTTATILTLYREDNTILRRYSLQRDTQGNITRIDPING